jgi:hypothetical protein
MNTATATRPRFQPLILPRRVRPLGEMLAPPRSLYFIYFPLLLTLTGVFTWITSTPFFMVVACAVGSAVGLYLIWDWLIRKGPTRFSTIMALGQLIGYCLGALNSWATTPRGGLTVGEYLGYDDGVLARAAALVLIANGTLLCLGEMFERPIFGREFRIPLDYRAYYLVYVGVVIYIGAFLGGALSVMGVQGVENGNVGIFKTFLQWFFPPLAAFSMAVFLAVPSGIHKKLTAIAALAMLVMMTILGRRIMIYSVVEMIFAVRFTGYKFKGSVFKRLFLAVALVFFIVVGALFFILLRVAGYGDAAQHKSLSQRLSAVSGWIADGTALERATSASSSDVQKRTFVLGFLGAVLEGSSTRAPAMGENAIGLIQLSVPSAIYHDKNKYYSEEATVDRLFGYGFDDEPNSILTNGATDFGFPGAIIYPLLLAYILRVYLEFISWHSIPLASTILAFALVYSSLQAENSLTEYFGSMIHGALFVIFLAIFFSLPRIQLQR